MTKEELRLFLERHIDRIEALIEKRKKLNNLYSKIRFGYFVIALLAIYNTYELFPDWAYLFSFIAWVAGFLVLIDRHRKVYHSQERFEHLRNIKKDHIARIDLNWENIKYNPTEVNIKNHPFAGDLDIVGKHSLHHLIDTSIYPASSNLLLDWFLSPSPKEEEVLKRQQQVKELIPLTLFRDKLRVIGLVTTIRSSVKNWSIDDMFIWLRLPKKYNYKLPLIILSILSALNIPFFVLLMIGKLNALPLTVSLVAYLLIYKFNDQKFKGLLDATFQIERILSQLESILFHVERFKPKKGSELEKLLANFQDEKTKPSLFIKKTQKLMSRAALQANKMLSGIINVLVPWDLYYAMRVEDLKRELENKLTRWLDTFYEVEALNSLANFAMLNPEYAWPNFEVNSNLLFNSTELGHPLISSKQRISNDFQVQKEKDLFLITGSNMAGKSTFLRTVGVNLVIAYSGAPVCAKSFQTGFFRVFSSINITDSLDDGLSHFYTEVKRLRYLLDELGKEDEIPLFFFVDEIYRGTNNRERFAGSAAFLKEVAGKNGIGLVSSHDLELAYLDKEIPQLSNWHFVESIKDGVMSFEYKLKTGPCPSTNALQIMKMEGLPT
tara:strand:+ start:17346 stop:19172 length:1827 start_codon:yes stop_codon:yes gene_type:complete